MHSRTTLVACLALALALLAVPAWAQTITSVSIVEKAGVTTTNYPVTLSLIFKQGDVASHVTANVGGQTVTTQTDVKVRWPDNTVKHALVSFRIPSLAASSHRHRRHSSGGTNANSDYVTKASCSRPTATPR